jgi:hypothetical protein
MQEPDGQPNEWLTLAEAARRLNTSVDALRKQIKRGRREGRRDNHGQWLVRAVQADNAHRLDGRRIRSGRMRRDVQVDSLAAELATIKAELSMSRGELADLRAERDRQVTELRAERDDLRTELATVRAERDAARVEAAELRGRLAEATRPGPLGSFLQALASRLLRTGAGSS